MTKFVVAAFLGACASVALSLDSYANDIEPIRVGPAKNDQRLPAAFEGVAEPTQPDFVPSDKYAKKLSKSCAGPADDAFKSCSGQIKESVSQDLRGSCKLLLIETDSQRSQSGTMSVLKWNGQKYEKISPSNFKVQLGKGGIGFGNGYQSLANNPYQAKTQLGQTPSGFYSLRQLGHDTANQRCVNDIGSPNYNTLVDVERSSDAIGYSPLTLMVNYRADSESPLSEKNGSCIFVQPEGNKGCAERGCVTFPSAKVLELTKLLSNDRASIGVFTSDVRKDLAACVPGLNDETVAGALKTAVRPVSKPAKTTN